METVSNPLHTRMGMMPVIVGQINSRKQTYPAADGDRGVRSRKSQRGRSSSPLWLVAVLGESPWDNVQPIGGASTTQPLLIGRECAGLSLRQVPAERFPAFGFDAIDDDRSVWHHMTPFVVKRTAGRSRSQAASRACRSSAGSRFDFKPLHAKHDNAKLSTVFVPPRFTGWT